MDFDLYKPGILVGAALLMAGCAQKTERDIEGRFAKLIKEERTWVRQHAKSLVITRTVKTAVDAEETLKGDTTQMMQTLKILEDLDLDRVLKRARYDLEKEENGSNLDETYTLHPGERSMIKVIDIHSEKDENGQMKTYSLLINQIDENKLYTARSMYEVVFGDGYNKVYRNGISQQPMGGKAFDFGQVLEIKVK